MEQARSFSQYAKNPAGRYWVGEQWLTFCARPTLWGFALWGRVPAASIEPLLAALKLELSATAAPHASVVDASRLLGSDPAGFEALQQYVTDHHAALARQVTRLAIVHPTGFEGAVVAGFFGVLEAPYPVVLTKTLGEALAALDANDTIASLGPVVEEASGADALLVRLRALLTRTPRLDVGAAARALAVSPRTLQRRLGEQGTSFVRLAADVRLDLALTRIKTTEAPLVAVALDAGFSSAQHMSTAVKRATGKTPSALRERR